MSINRHFSFLAMLLFAGLAFLPLYAAEKNGTSPGRWIVWSGKEAPSWEHAFVTGNGRQGTMVMGHTNDERIICVHEELFIRSWDHNKVTVPKTAHLLPEVRALMEAGQSDKASRLLTDEADKQLKEMGASQRWPLIPHPAFDFRIRMNEGREPGKISHYRRQLNLETGEVASFWNDDEGGMTESVFSSRKHNVNVIRLKGKDGRKINATLGLEETPGRQGYHFEHDLDHAFSSVTSSASPGWLRYHAEYSKDPGGYDGLARISLKGGKMTCEGNKLRIEGADEVLAVVRVTPLQDGKKSSAESVKKELAGLPGDYDELLQAHSPLHGKMFRRMQLDLGCADEWQKTPTEEMLDTVNRQGVTPLFLEQIHAMGRYLLISSSGKYPPPLQGIWGGGWKPAWIGGFVWDSNINLAISSASMGNLPECAETYCNYVESLLPGWRLNAKNYLGCRGFVVAHYNDPTNGYLTHFGGSFPWMFWAGGAGWNIRPFYDHAMFTGDTKFLKQRVLPLYREMADFYEDYLTPGPDSLYHICPSISPENAPVGTDTWLSKDSTMDVAIAREVFTLLGQMGKQFGSSSQDTGKWSSYLHKLPAYRINEDGALAEWVDPGCKDIYNHRHNSHLYPVFPGTELVGPHADKNLQKAARTALDKRFAFDTSSAHGLIHLALQAVRLKDLDKVRQNLDRFSKRKYFYNSLVSSHEPSGGIYNLDSVLSFPRLLMEMLVYAQPGKIELLPAWLEGYPDGSVQGMKIMGGHTLDMSWKKGEITNLSIRAASSRPYTISWKNRERKIQLQAGETYKITPSFFNSHE